MLPWVPAVFGVGIMLGLLVFAVVSLRPSDPDGVSLPAAVTNTPPFLAGPSVPDSGDSGVATPEAPRASVTPSPTPARTTAAPRPTRTTAPPAPPPPPAPELTGRYRVVESFSDTFIGEVRVANSANGARNWTVRLEFPANVGGLRTFWVEGAQQPKLQRSGNAFIFTSGASVGAGKVALLRFQFNRTGSVSTPTACSVNGTACSGL
ncbi:cellulose binding domain-containing protein [Phytohabitans rumicis]|uniref:CBM2 domain-containing protein n=1 Tax=Phytohabitans rumicis TaxID=1076125 RepID=A0A6V8L859_9ACTN|nr:cellulose binding domain-containing protein [Phytohabitans rumicis]GFJ90819.1 hypothetical protein Prum_044610 [Phytohabitans rumicis]